MSIQIFACDHRKNIDWKLPYIRIGGQESDCAINIKDDPEIAPYSILLSEGAKIWWVYKHLADFGNPEYVGFCHYRRFFTINAKVPIIDVPAQKMNYSWCLNPTLQENILINNKASILAPIPIQVVETGILDISEQIYCLDKSMDVDINDKLFDMYKKNFPENLQKYFDEARKQQRTHLCNIFTIKTDLFKIYANAAFKALVEFNTNYRKKTFHTRYMGYYLERLTSVFIYLMYLSGEKIINIPLLTVDGNKHIAP